MHERNNDIVAKANEFVGIRYRFKGRHPSTGLDCAGVPLRVCHELGLTSYDNTNYGRRPTYKDCLAILQGGNFQRIPTSDCANGDLLWLNSHRWAVHFGVYEMDEHQEEWIIHAYIPHKKVTRDPIKHFWHEVVAVWRFPS